jgi:hypothetical protein
MKNHKTIIFSILFCILIANIFIFEYIFNKKYFDYRFNEKILSIEKSINYELAIIGHIFKGIAETIKEDRVFLNPEKMQDFVKNFDPQYDFNFKSNGLIEGILILDKNGKELVNTILPGINNRLKNDPNSENIRCLQEAGDTDFNLVVNSIRIGNYNKDFIVPVNMKIADHTGKYMGVICSGIVVKKLLEDINSRFGYSSIEGVIISNVESQDAVNVNSLGIIETLSAFLTDDMTILSYKMQEIPIFIELRIKYWYFKLALARFCLFIFLLSFFAIVIIYIYI